MTQCGSRSKPERAAKETNDQLTTVKSFRPKIVFLFTVTAAKFIKKQKKQQPELRCVESA